MSYELWFEPELLIEGQEDGKRELYVPYLCPAALTVTAAGAGYHAKLLLLAVIKKSRNQRHLESHM